MIRIIVINFFLVLFQGLLSQGNFELAIDGHFNVPRMDTAAWQDKYPWGRSNLPSSKEYNTNGRNFSFHDSSLTVNLRRENIEVLSDSSKPADKIMYDGKPNLRQFRYTSGLLCSKRKFLYGKFALKCKLPEGRGTWPAFWLWGGEEIDIFERPWKFHNVLTTNYHYDSAGTTKQDFRFHHFAGRNIFSNDFHVFTLEWYPDSIRWFVDGQLIRTEYHSYHHGMYVIATNSAAQDNFWGHAPTKRGWTAQMHIAYVRVWKLKQGLN